MDGSRPLLHPLETPMPKRPQSDEVPGGTAMMNLDETSHDEEDSIKTGQAGLPQATIPAPSADDNPGATAFVKLDEPAADENPGATAFVRLDAPGAPGKSAPIPRRHAPAAMPSAPKKGPP